VAPQFKGLAVLLVDDDPQQAAATRAALHKLGCNPVGWATNWVEARRVAATTSPKLFVVDARLFERAAGMLTRLSLRFRAPVIVLVEEADTSAVRHAMKIQGATPLVKPYDRTTLAVAIAQALKLATDIRSDTEAVLDTGN
jgi:DNA-binding NtrC family response regulator